MASLPEMQMGVQMLAVEAMAETQRPEAGFGIRRSFGNSISVIRGMASIEFPACRFLICPISLSSGQ
jgi:hypothetical protein